MSRSHYVMLCPLCGHRQEDDGLVLDCPRPHAPALLQAEYRSRSFTPKSSESGIFRYRDWLPIIRSLGDEQLPIVYRSARLGPQLGLRNLWICFNGYWPARGAWLESCSFKEFEALCVLGRLPREAARLVVASAGNTANAFLNLCSRYRVPLLIVVPGRALPRLHATVALDPCVKVISVEDGEYTDCIHLADKLSKRPGFTAEGGTRNVARRDGLATVMLAAFETMGQLPDYYVQAVGSGAGAIAVHAAARRLCRAEPGRQMRPPQLLLCQNAGFAPVYDAWRGLTSPGESPQIEARRLEPAPTHRGFQGFADELTTRIPPFAHTGGVRDALQESGGDVLVADRPACVAAMRMFEDLEEIDIEPAAAVAVAGLAQAARDGRIPPDATVLLNITGGGRALVAQHLAPNGVRPHRNVRLEDLPPGGNVEDVLMVNV